MDGPPSDFGKPPECHALATDLDGTLIPLEGNDRNVMDLKVLASALTKRDRQLVFVTGRHLASVQNAIEYHELPTPHAIICDVGTSIYYPSDQAKPELATAYMAHLGELVASMQVEHLKELLTALDGITPQEEEKQGLFKLSYYVEAKLLDRIVGDIQTVLERTKAPYTIVSSVDPFNGDGLIDLLPKGVSKAYALKWWAGKNSFADEAIVFAGDSGNDLAALTAGYRAIVVGNADRIIAEQARKAHQASSWEGRLCVAKAHATSGVLEGCRWFGLID